jgi:hypothetical protein
MVLPVDLLVPSERSRKCTYTDRKMGLFEESPLSRRLLTGVPDLKAIVSVDYTADGQTVIKLQKKSSLSWAVLFPLIKEILEEQPVGTTMRVDD